MGKKNYIWVATITSPQGCKTLYGCLDKQKLIEYLSDPRYDDFRKGEIKRSGIYYNTDGNTDIWYKV